MRHLGTSVTPFVVPERRWHGNASPTSQSSSTGSVRADDVLQRAQVRGCAAGSPRSSVAGPGRRRWRRAGPGWRSAGMAASGARRLRHAGAAPTSAKPMRRPAGPSAAPFVGGPLHDDLAGVEPSGRGDHEQRTAPASRGWQPVPRRPQHRRAAACPVRQLPSTGMRARIEAVRQPGSRAVDAGGSGGAALGAGLAAGDDAVVGVGEVAAAGRLHHGVGGDVGGNPVGGEALVR